MLMYLAINAHLLITLPSWHMQHLAMPIEIFVGEWLWWNCQTDLTDTCINPLVAFPCAFLCICILLIYTLLCLASRAPLLPSFSRTIWRTQPHLLVVWCVKLLSLSVRQREVLLALVQSAGGKFIELEQVGQIWYWHHSRGAKGWHWPCLRYWRSGSLSRRGIWCPRRAMFEHLYKMSQWYQRKLPESWMPWPTGYGLEIFCKNYWDLTL